MKNHDTYDEKILERLGAVIPKDAVIIEKKTGLPGKFKVPRVIITNKSFLGGG